MLRHTVFLLSTVFAVAMITGCGSESTQNGQPQYRHAVGSPKNTPTPLPTRTVQGSGFDRSAISDRFLVTLSGPYWVQLVDREAPSSIIVVGIEPTRSGYDLEGAVEMQRSEMDNPPQSMFLESGVFESDVLGVMQWTSSRYQIDEQEIQQIALFGAHPADGCLVIARSEFPENGGSFQSKLDELVTTTEIIGPGL